MDKKKATEKRRVLVPTWSYLPAFEAGGPIKSIANLASALSAELEFWIVCRDRAKADGPAFECAKAGKWIQQGPARVLYVQPGLVNLVKALRLVGKSGWDLLYLNSFFDPTFSVLPLIMAKINQVRAKKVLIAPRGEFSPGAMALKNIKKRCFLAFARQSGVYASAHWHATNEDEKRFIADAMHVDTSLIHVCPNLPSMPARLPEIGLAAKPGDRKHLRLIYLSRVAQKKNLKFAIEVLRQVPFPVELDVYGPISEPDYWRECEAEASSLSGSKAVHYKGIVAPKSVLQIMSGYDALFLPTMGENYGHVIVEAWQAGIPVLISDQTPWRNLAPYGLGFDLPVSDRHGFIAAISVLASQSESERTEQRRRCLAKAGELVSDKAPLDLAKEMFCSAVQG